MTVQDVVQMMEKEKQTSLPLNNIVIVAANGHIVDPTDSVAIYVQSSVSLTVMFLVTVVADVFIGFTSLIYFLSSLYRTGFLARMFAHLVALQEVQHKVS